MHNFPFSHYLTQLCQHNVIFFFTCDQLAGRTSSARGCESNVGISKRLSVFAQSPNLFFRSNLTASPKCDSRSFAVQSHRTCSAFPGILYTTFSPAKLELSGVFIFPHSLMSYTHTHKRTHMVWPCGFDFKRVCGLRTAQTPVHMACFWQEKRRL